MQTAIIERARALLADGTVARVIGWKKGEFDWDESPAIFTSVEELDSGFVYDDFSGSNLSKYLLKETRKPGKTLVFLKPCDSFGFGQLLAEHRVKREAVYAIGVPCRGLIDAERVIAAGAAGATGMASDGSTVTVKTLYGEKRIPKADVLEERCEVCRGDAHVSCDEIIAGEAVLPKLAATSGAVGEKDRFAVIEKLEAMSPAERFAFWQGELSRCVRCNACRNVCPVCTCEKCVFDNDASGVATKASAVQFEENMFHIIRAFHVAGRCTDCGACSRACPQHIPLHLLNRKFIKDINGLYGDYQAGADPELASPLGRYDKGDAEPSIVREREGGKA
jgi:ferredoxin